MQYVWRVQAFDKSGRDAYQNNGYSQSCVFTYGGVDPFVVNNIGKAALLGDALGERSGKWWWHLTNAQTVDGWNIQYRKKGDSANKGAAYSWNKQYLTDTLFHLFNLEPDNSYEAQVQPVIKGINGFWSEMVPLHTFPKRVYECGKNDTANNGLGAAAAGQPLNTAVAGMVVRVGSFDMQLLKVQGGNGRFTGYGAIATPLLGMRLNVKFTDVQINDKLQLTQGEVVALSEGIDAWIKDRTKTNDDVQTIKDWKETMPDFDTASLATLKDFATELLGISPGIWSDTYVFTDQERKDVMAAIQEVQAAMKDLNDSDPSNDAAAEKKLRGALKKAEPMLEKLSNNIGKGVTNKLGDLVKSLREGIQQLLGTTVKDDAKALAKLEAQIKALAEKELPKVLLDSLNTALQQMADAKSAWDAATDATEKAAAEKRYEDAKKALSAIQDQKDKLINDVADIIITSVKKIRTEKDSLINSVNTFNQDVQAFNKELDASQGITDADDAATDNYMILGEFGATEEYTDNTRAEYLKKATSLLTRKKTLKGAVVYKIFTDFFSQADKVSANIMTDEKINGRDLVNQLIQKQTAGETREKMLAFAHDYLVKALEQYIATLDK
jgi:hypothetical protein